MKVKVISLPYIFQVLYVLCFTRPRYQVSVYRTIGPLVRIPPLRQFYKTWFYAESTVIPHKNSHYLICYKGLQEYGDVHIMSSSSNYSL